MPKKSRGKFVELFCPDGHPIRGTLEKLEGTALVIGAYDKGKGEELDIEYEGTTDMSWDSQQSVYESLERVWVCSEGELFRESQLVKKRPKPTRRKK